MASKATGGRPDGGVSFLSRHWKEAIEKESTIRKQWQQKYYPEKVQEEKEKLHQSIKAAAEKEKMKKTIANHPQRKLIYEGVSKEGGGRMSYLRSRKEESPTKKYNFPVSSSQTIGWLVEQSWNNKKDQDSKSNLANNYGKKAQTKTFYRRDGVGFTD